MVLSELQTRILTDLSRAGNMIEDLPKITGHSDDAIEEAIEGLRKHGCVEVVGPPNQNSAIGKDVDELHLLQAGANALRSLRR
jgi:hypothetical protein